MDAKTISVHTLGRESDIVFTIKMPTDLWYALFYYDLINNREFEENYFDLMTNVPENSIQLFQNWFNIAVKDCK